MFFHVNSSKQYKNIESRFNDYLLKGQYRKMILETNISCHQNVQQTKWLMSRHLFNKNNTLKNSYSYLDKKFCKTQHFKVVLQTRYYIKVNWVNILTVRYLHVSWGSPFGHILVLSMILTSKTNDRYMT